MSNMNRLRGLRALLEDAVEHGASAVERVHRATAARPFDVLDQLPPIAPAARGVRVIHDAMVSGVYETIRRVNHLVGATLSTAIDLYAVAQRHQEGNEHPARAGAPDPEPTSEADPRGTVQADPGRTSELDRERASEDTGETRG